MNILTFSSEEGETPAESQVPELQVSRQACPFRKSEGIPEPERRWLFSQAVSRCIKTPGAHVIQPNAFSFKMLPLLIKARRAGIPVLYNVTIMPETPPEAGAVRLRKQWLEMKLSFGLVTRFVCLSQEMARTYRRHAFLREDQVVVIPNGVDTQRFHPAVTPDAKRQIRETLGLPPDAPVVLFVGGIMPRKGVDILVRSWPAVLKRHPSAKLVLLGSHSARRSHRSDKLSGQLHQYLAGIHQKITTMPEPNSVILPGDLEDPVPWYQSADLFAFPSHREGLPNAVLEAMACQLPCLVADFQGLPAPGEELGWPNRHYQIVTNNPDAWAEALIMRLRSDELDARWRMGREARRWIEGIHRLDSVLDQWANLYTR